MFFYAALKNFYKVEKNHVETANMRKKAVFWGKKAKNYHLNLKK